MPSLTRRRLLAGAGGAVGAGGLAAVLSGRTAAGAADLATEALLGLDSTYTRATGDPLAVERSTTPGEAGVEYLPDRDVVRYDHYGGDGESPDSRMPFERWARLEGSGLAAESVLPTVDDRRGEPVTGVGRGVAHRYFGLVVVLDYVVDDNGDGSPAEPPNLGFDDLVAVAPRSIEASVSLGDRSHTSSFPVVVRRADAPVPLAYDDSNVTVVDDSDE